MELIDKFHIIDIFFLIIFLRIVFIAFSRGLLNEFIKLIGLSFASFFSFQYYSLFLGEVFGKEPFSFNQEHLNLISFLIIFFVVVFIFFLLRRAVVPFLKQKKYSLWEKGLASLLGCCRALFSVSIIIFILWLSPFSFKGVFKSFSYKKFKSIAPLSYLGSFKFYKTINPQSQLNKEVVTYYEAKEYLPRGD